MSAVLYPQVDGMQWAGSTYISNERFHGLLIARLLFFMLYMVGSPGFAPITSWVSDPKSLKYLYIRFSAN